MENIVLHPNIDASRLCVDVKKPAIKIDTTVEHPNSTNEHLCNGKSSNHQSKSESRKPEAVDSDEELKIFVDHPNMSFSRNADVMNIVNPPCLFVCHPNMTATRIPKFQSCPGCQDDSPKKKVAAKSKPACKPTSYRAYCEKLSPVVDQCCQCCRKVMPPCPEIVITKDSQTENELETTRCNLSSRPTSALKCLPSKKTPSKISFCKKTAGEPVAWEMENQTRKASCIDALSTKKSHVSNECSSSCFGCGKRVPIDIKATSCSPSPKATSIARSKSRTSLKTTQATDKSCCQRSCEGRIK